jgi:quercetin dioxygenase-like cupin family protein
MSSPFYFVDADTPWTDVGGGIRRKIIGHMPGLMSVIVQFDKGAIGVPHLHEEHEQIAVVLAGSFDADIGGEKRVIRTGDAYIVPKNVLHGVVALEQDSVLLDQFSPRRDDFL